MRIFSYLKIALLLSLVELALAGARTREIALGKDDDKKARGKPSDRIDPSDRQHVSARN